MLAAAIPADIPIRFSICRSALRRSLATAARSLRNNPTTARMHATGQDPYRCCTVADHADRRRPKETGSVFSGKKYKRVLTVRRRSAACVSAFFRPEPIERKRNAERFMRGGGLSPARATARGTSLPACAVVVPRCAAESTRRMLSTSRRAQGDSVCL
jgi:hypothetical protein